MDCATVRRLGLIALLSVLIPVGPSAEESAPKSARSVPDALKKGDYRIGLRYRWDHADDENPAFAGRGATASTLRTALRYRSATYYDVGIVFEVENVTNIGKADAHNNLGFGDLNNGVRDRPVIADPALTDVLQAAVRYDGVKDTTFAGGREELSFREQRFVGSVAWRQHHQSFDALHVETSAIPRTKLSYAFLDRQNTVTGASLSMDSNVLFADIDVGGPGTLTVYGVEIDYKHAPVNSISTATWGARFKGQAKVSKRWSIPYHAELATQSDTGGNPNNIDAGYLRVEVGGVRKKLWIKGAYEVLEGDPTDGAFSTPLATLHKWNGWADKFLITPATGLRDLSIGAGSSNRRTKCMVVYHRFEADTGGADYGTEWDLLFGWTSKWKQEFYAKAAFYDAKDFDYDTEKVWLYTTYKFGSS